MHPGLAPNSSKTSPANETGEGLGDGDASGDGLGDGLGERLGDGLGDAFGEGLGAGLGEGKVVTLGGMAIACSRGGFCLRGVELGLGEGDGETATFGVLAGVGDGFGEVITATFWGVGCTLAVWRGASGTRGRARRIPWNPIEIRTRIDRPDNPLDVLPKVGMLRG